MTNQSSPDINVVVNNIDTFESPLKEIRSHPEEKESFQETLEGRDECLKMGRSWEGKYKDLQERFAEEVAKKVRYWRRKAEELDHRNTMLSNECERFEADVAHLQNEKQELVTTIKSCELRLNDLVEDNQLIASKNESSNSTIQQLVSQNQILVSTNESRSKVLQELLSDNKSVGEKFAATVRELGYTNNQLEVRNRELIHKHVMSETAVQQLEEKCKKQAAIINHSSTKIKDLKNHKEEVTKKYELSKRKVHYLKKMNGDLAMTVENTGKQLKVLYKSNQELLKKYESSQTQVRELKELCQSLDMMVKKSNTRFKDLQNHNEEMAIKFEISNIEFEQLKKKFKDLSIKQRIAKDESQAKTKKSESSELNINPSQTQKIQSRIKIAAKFKNNCFPRSV